MKVSMINSYSYSSNLEITASLKHTVKINKTIQESNSRPTLNSVPNENKDVFDLVLDNFKQSSLDRIMPEERMTAKQTYSSLPFSLSNKLLPPPSMHRVEDDAEVINNKDRDELLDGPAIHDFLANLKDNQTLPGKHRVQYTRHAKSSVSQSKGMVIDVEA